MMSSYSVDVVLLFQVKRLQSVIQHRDAQYKHEVRKKERESLKLKERMHTLIADKTDRRIGNIRSVCTLGSLARLWLRYFRFAKVL